jgi:putative PIN family toxin of toxin-antitoxin system
MQPDRVFVDTNVLVSGTAFKGNERELIRMGVAGIVKLVLADAVILEARRVIRDKFPEYESGLDWVLTKADYHPVPRPSPRQITAAARLVRDPDDAAVLASILASNPDVALTGDKDLLTDEVKAIAPMCTCAEYLRRLGEA